MFNKTEPEQVNLSAKKGLSLKIDEIKKSDRFFEDLDDLALKKYATARGPRTP